MRPIVKKAAAAIAIKEGIDKLQEMRKPKKPSLMQRLLPFGIVAAIAGLGLFVYKNKFSGDGGTYDVDTSTGVSSSASAL